MGNLKNYNQNIMKSIAAIALIGAVSAEDWVKGDAGKKDQLCKDNKCDEGLTCVKDLQCKSDASICGPWETGVAKRYPEQKDKKFTFCTKAGENEDINCDGKENVHAKSKDFKYTCTIAGAMSL